MAEESDLEKTEAPTAHREEKAREEGQIPRSRELTSVLLLVTGFSIMWFGGANMARKLSAMIAQGLRFEHELINNDKQMLMQLDVLLKQAVSALLPFMGGAVLVAIAAPMLLGGVLFSTKSFKFDLSKMNPLSGLKRMFSSQALAELFKGILKSVIVGGIAGGYLWHHWREILHLLSEPPITALGDALEMVFFCGLLVLIGLIPMVAFDVFWQIWSHIKKLRMTKQEIRDEHKEHEGDPHVKGRIRRQQREMAKRRMMADVPKANVIVTNPTHYAVALQYDDKKMSAPKLLAKGTDEVALRIRELAKEHRIPILEAPPLARALYRHTEIGHNIPAQLYAAVAEVLAWVYQLKRWRREGGLIPKKPKHLPVPAELDIARENTTDG